MSPSSSALTRLSRPRFSGLSLFGFISLVALASILFLSTQNVYSADVTLAWDPNSEPDLDGYRIFYRQEGQSYNYDNPAWEGTETSCTIYNLDNETTYYFVARAFDTSGNESGDSNEVSCKPSLDPDIPESNLPPWKPVITSPYYGQLECDLLLLITAEPFSDPDADSHSQSQWQISNQEGFSSLVLDVTSTKHLTELPVPHMVLEPDTTYYARAQFYDAYLEPSAWSDTIEFTTTSAVNDFDADGIPDDQEVGDDVDLNGDGIADNDQPGVIKCVQSTDGVTTIGVCKTSDAITAIEALDTIDPSTISDNVNRPENLFFGLFSYRLRVNAPGATVTVRIYFSEDISEARSLYKYDTISGWQDYSQRTTFDDARSVTLEFVDGGYGDSDGTANGVIVDPGGLLATASSGGVEISEGSTYGEGCFIATAALGSYVEPHVKVLRDLRDEYLLTNGPGRWFVGMYYRYSPFWAKVITIHSWCKPVLRLALMPLVGVSYVLVKASLAMKLLAGLLLAGFVLGCFAKLPLCRSHNSNDRCR